MVRKALISPGYGAGWSTWLNEDDPEARAFILFDPILVAAIERDGGASPEAVDDFEERYTAKFGEEPGYLGGARDLKVIEIEGQFKVDEYDGFESVTYRSDKEGWI